MSDKTSLSDLARKAGFDVLRNGIEPIYIANQIAIERLLALHVAELCADAEPVYQIENEWEEWCDFQQSDYETFAGNKRILYPAETVAALQARVAELAKDAERYRWLRQAPWNWDADGTPRASPWVVTGDTHADATPITLEELDAAIDEALRSKK